MMDTPPAGFGDPTCAHLERREGVCIHCGHCQHEVILNGACFLCGTTDLDPIAMSPQRRRPGVTPTVIPASSLNRKK